jgi:hypothetical protein
MSEARIYDMPGDLTASCVEEPNTNTFDIVCLVVRAWTTFDSIYVRYRYVAFPIRPSRPTPTDFMCRSIGWDFTGKRVGESQVCRKTVNVVEWSVEKLSFHCTGAFVIRRRRELQHLRHGAALAIGGISRPTMQRSVSANTFLCVVRVESSL